MLCPKCKSSNINIGSNEYEQSYNYCTDQIIYSEYNIVECEDCNYEFNEFETDNYIEFIKE